MYRPQVHLRQQPVEIPSTALLFVDIQNYNCHPDGALSHESAQDAAAAKGKSYFWHAVEAAKPKWTSLQHLCQEAGVEVVYTVIQSLTRNGRDRSLDYKISGFHVPPGCWDAQMLECVTPAADEIIIPKTSSSVFISTNINYILHNLRVRHLIVCGCLTDQCVEHCIRDACDTGYLVTQITDCCVTYSEARQQASLSNVAGYCRQRTVEDMRAELAEQVAKSPTRQPQCALQVSPYF